MAYAALSDGASTSVSLTQGWVIRTTGSGLATFGPGPMKGQTRGLDGKGTVGPFDYAVTVYLTGRQSLAYETSDPAAYAAALQQMLSGAGNSLPAPPLSVYAQAGNASATVQWSSTHALPTSWIVTASPGGATATVSASVAQGSATVTGLTNGVAYTFTVAGVNSTGTGRSSAASNSVTPTALPSSTLPVTRGLEFWWSSAQATSPGNGNPLTSLVDFSGNGYTFAGQGTGSGGTWVSSWSGGKPAVALNGTNQYYHALATGYYAGMRGPAGTIYVLHDVQAQPASIGYVLSAIRPSANAGALNQGFGLGVKLGAAGKSDEIVMDGIVDYLTAASATIVGSDVTWATPIRATVTMPGVLRVNGVAVSGAVDPRMYAGAGNQPWTIGSMYGNGFNYNLQGRIAEVIIFNVVHTSAEIALMETYLATRF